MSGSAAPGFGLLSAGFDPSITGSVTLPELSVTAPDSQAQAQPASIPDRFVGALQAGGLTNPNGLGAVAAYAQHESRYSPSNITGSWSDPSESGQAGTSGGILSWRGDRLANMKAFTAGASDPVTAQASFLLQENPQLTQALQNAKSPAEANQLMAQAWKFAGYNQPGGEYASRLATTQQYASRLGSGASMGSTAQQGGFGLSGIQSQGAPVPGQASASPGSATFSSQPTPTPDPIATQPQQQASAYDGVAKALQAAAGKQQQKQSGGMQQPQVQRPHPIGLQQARQLFDASRFYTMLQGQR